MSFFTTCRGAIAGLLLAALSVPASAGTTESFTFKAKSYPGSRDRQYQVYVPSSATGAAPLVMALHGCQETSANVTRDWGLTAAADRYGFVLVTPFITSYTGLRNTNCWGFWLDAERHQGKGEAEDLRNIAAEVESKRSIDPKRRYITGLSSGGAMAVVAAVTHNEYWAASASASGLPYGEDASSVSFSGCPGSAFFHPISRVAADIKAEVNAPYQIPLMVLQNTKDCTVINQAGINIRDSHLLAFGKPGRDTAATTRARSGVCTPVFGSSLGCEHLYYTVDGSATSRSLVETIFYTGPTATSTMTDTDHGHYWIGGENGLEGNWAIKTGPSYPDIIWDFFSRHPRGANDAPVITLNGSNPMNLKVGDTFSDPGATATDPQDGSVPVTADCKTVNTAVAGTYACTYTATDKDKHTTVATRNVVVGNVTIPPEPPVACLRVVTSPVLHLAFGRAIGGGLFGLRALSTGDRADIGASFDSWSWVTLYQGSGGWYATKPANCS